MNEQTSSVNKPEQILGASPAVDHYVRQLDARIMGAEATEDTESLRDLLELRTAIGNLALERSADGSTPPRVTRGDIYQALDTLTGHIEDSPYEDDQQKSNSLAFIHSDARDAANRAVGDNEGHIE